MCLGYLRNVISTAVNLSEEDTSLLLEATSPPAGRHVMPASSSSNISAAYRPCSQAHVMSSSWSRGMFEGADGAGLGGIVALLYGMVCILSALTTVFEYRSSLTDYLID